MTEETPEYTLDFLEGNCPVYGEGSIDGQPFDFRARGSSWKVTIQGLEGEWSYGGDYGSWPDAGWMSEDEAKAFLEKALRIYREGSHEVELPLKPLKDALETLHKAVEPFAFTDDETVQEAWELRYRDRFKDWIDFQDLEQARAAFSEGELVLANFNAEVSSYGKKVAQKARSEEHVKFMNWLKAQGQEFLADQFEELIEKAKDQ